MTKDDLTRAVKARMLEDGHAELTLKDTAFLVEQVFELAAFSLKADGEFAYPGFGTLKKKHRAAKAGVNPRTGKPIEIGAHNAVTFKPAPRLLDRLNPSPL